MTPEISQTAGVGAVAYQRTEVLLAEVRQSMQIEHWYETPQGSLVLTGQLYATPRKVYRRLQRSLHRRGFTPLLRSAPDDRVQVVLFPGVPVVGRPRYWLAGLLFVLTFVSVVLTGASNQGVDVLRQPAEIVRGLPFALALLGILGSHELGHYLVGRWRGSSASLPYFIPIPWFISFTGTLGAVIVQREPFEDRRTTLEIGIAGPLAGLAVALPLLVYGLATSQVGPLPPGAMVEGNSVVYMLAKLLVFGRVLPAGGVDVYINDIAFAAWIGLLITMINLLPVGQLDGGHIAYALFGRGATYIGYGALVMCAVLAFTVSPAWGIWGVLALATGPRHPAPMNELTRLSLPHIMLAASGLALFFLLLVPVPFQ